MTKTPKWIQKLVAMSACKEALRWARTQPDLKTAWNKCKRPDWMWWLLYEVRDEMPGGKVHERMRAEMDWLSEQHSRRFEHYCKACDLSHAIYPERGRTSPAKDAARCDFIRYYFPTPGPQRRTQ